MPTSRVKKDKNIDKGNKSKHLPVRKRKTLVGKVVSKKMEKTVIVEITSKMAHPKYKKVVTKTKRYKARASKQIDVGKFVRIEQSRPFSKEVSWRVIEVIE